MGLAQEPPAGVRCEAIRTNLVGVKERPESR
jgi:hypothetical protein